MFDAGGAIWCEHVQRAVAASDDIVEPTAEHGRTAPVEPTSSSSSILAVGPVENADAGPAVEEAETFILRVPGEVTSMGWLPSAMPPARVYVRIVVTNSWAHQQGMRMNDELREVGGFQVALLSRAEFMRAMQRRPLELVFRRAGPEEWAAVAAEEIEAQEVTEDEEDEEEAEEDSEEDLFLEGETWGSIFGADRSDSEVTEDIAEEIGSWRSQLEEGSDVSDLDAGSSVASESFAHGAELDTEDEDVLAPLSFAANLPTHHLTERDVIDCPRDRSECLICLEEYAVGDVQLTLPCFHRFHDACAQQWLRRSETCPTCKYSIACDSFFSDEV